MFGFRRSGHIYNIIVTALSEYLDRPAIFLWAYLDLILFMAICVFYWSSSIFKKYAELQFLHSQFSKISPIFPEFCSLFLGSYFSKTFAGKIGAALVINKRWSATQKN